MPSARREARLFPPDLFERDPGDGRWWVAHVRGRHEKMLAGHLLRHAVPHYLPQRERKIQYRGRTRVSHLPLFSGYVFLAATPAQRVTALTSDAIVSFLEVKDQLCMHRELCELWRLERCGADLLAHPYLDGCNIVEVVDGPFKGARGTFLRYKGTSKLIISITLLRRSVAVEVERGAVSPLAA
jgi:hypothetical protein